MRHGQTIAAYRVNAHGETLAPLTDPTLHMERRTFNATLAAAGLGLAQESLGAVGTPELIRLSLNGWMPNNEGLPVLLYGNAIALQGQDPAAVFEAEFKRNGWPPQWRDGVYDFHHYHSTAHEVLGFARGHAKLMLGGENGHALEIRAGDVLVLPTGTGHCKLQASPEFLVVGAYPPDQQWDICRAAPSAESLERMRGLPFPKSDPVTGADGPLTIAWRTG